MPRNTLRDQLMHSNGTTPHETLTVIVPTLFYTTITTVIVSLLNLRIRNKPIRFCVEFSTLVLPIILNVTVLADRTFEVLTTSCMICMTLLLFLTNLKPLREETPKVKQDCITNSRSTINIISVVGILAVDFLIFPRTFAKTESFGYSLMDVGVGLYIFSNAIVDGGKTDLIKSLKGSVPLFVLGLGRLLVTRRIDYHVPVSEYGLHWNFFITLGVTKIFASLIFSVIDVRYVSINATLILMSHETLLQMGLKNFVIANTKRTDLLVANKEGLVSLMGYVSLYLYSAWFSDFLELKKGPKNRKRTILKFLFLSFFTLFLSLFFASVFGISRKLANAAYCFWILFIGIFMTALYYIFGKFLEDIFIHRLKIPVHLPFIFQAINYNGLAFFLVSNLLTGLVNTLCDTLKVNTIFSLVILSIYMLINCVVVCVLYTKQIKIKL